MQRFERKTKKSHPFTDFWEVELDGTQLRWRDGYCGKAGGGVTNSTETNDYKSVAIAQRELSKLIGVKKRQKFREVEMPVFVAPATPIGRDPALEAAIAAAPDEPDNYLVYADRLTGQGDPRGELVVIQHALETATGKRAASLRGRQQALLAKHQAHLFGRFPPSSNDYPNPAVIRVVAWRRGFFRALELANDDWEQDPGVVAQLGEFFALPSARFVDSVHVNVLQWIAGSVQTPAAVAELGRCIGSQLRTLRIGPKSGDNIDNAHFRAGNLGAAWKRLPALESLTIRSGEFLLGKLGLPALRELVLETCGLRKAAMGAIVREPRGKLEKLVLWFGSTSYGANCKLADVQPVLDGTNLPRVTHLGLMNCEFTNAICEALPRAKILPRLKVLDLSMGCMDDTGARALVAHADAFAHLDELRLDENFLSKAGCKMVQRLAKTVTTKDQKDVDDSTGQALRYVSISE